MSKKSKVTDTFQTPLKDSGTRATFSTGAVRDNPDGKGRFDLLPVDAIAEVAKHFEKGANKYAARNWEKGINYSRYLDSALRHTFQFMGGARDEPHLIAATWNLLCLIQTIKWVETSRLPESLNDLPALPPKDAECICPPSAQDEACPVCIPETHGTIPEGLEVIRFYPLSPTGTYDFCGGLKYVEFTGPTLAFHYQNGSVAMYNDGPYDLDYYRSHSDCWKEEQPDTITILTANFEEALSESYQNGYDDGDVNGYCDASHLIQKAQKQTEWVANQNHEILIFLGERADFFDTSPMDTLKRLVGDYKEPATLGSDPGVKIPDGVYRYAYAKLDMDTPSDLIFVDGGLKLIIYRNKMGSTRHFLPSPLFVRDVEGLIQSGKVVKVYDIDQE